MAAEAPRELSPWERRFEGTIFEIPRYISAKTIKYGSDRIHYVFSERNRALAIRKVWVATAHAQMKAGIVTEEQYKNLRDNIDKIDIREAYRIELDRDYDRYTGHDMVAASMTFADVAPIGGPIIGKGETSEDPLSNSEIMLVKNEAMPIIEEELDVVLLDMAAKARKYKDVVCMGWTHLQAAEPTTVGYRLARYAQDLLAARRIFKFLKGEIHGKGIKGAVGTSAAFFQLLEGTGMTPQVHEDLIMEELGIDAALVTGQTYPRQYAMMMVTACSFIAQAANNFAGDLKLLQSSPFAEWAQPQRRNQVNSFAMPHKRNPDQAEGIKSVVREIKAFMGQGFDNAADVTLERGMEDSAHKRTFIPECFILTDEILTRMHRIVPGMEVREIPIGRNMSTFSPFVAMEVVLAELSNKPDVNRREMHELLRIKVAQAIGEVYLGNSNPLEQLINLDGEISRYLTPEEVNRMFEAVKKHIGDAPERAERMADIIEKELKIAA